MPISKTLGGILIGMIYSNTMFKSMKKPSISLGIPDVIEIKHSIPGRVRFHVPCMKNNTESKSKLLSTMKSVSSIEKISIDTLTSSILISYKEDEVSEEILLGALIKLLGLEEIIENHKDPVILSEIKRFNESLNYSFFKKTKGALDFNTLLPLMFIFFGLKKIYIKKGDVSANPYSLLYWAYKSLCL